MIFVIVTGKQQECDYELMICCYLHLVSMTVVVCVQWVIAEMIAQALATVLMLVSMHWFVFLLNFPVASWSVYRWFSPITPHTADTPLQLTVPDVCGTDTWRFPWGNMGVYDPTEIHNRGQLKSHMKEAMVKLGFHLLCFFIYLYR